MRTSKRLGMSALRMQARIGLFFLLSTAVVADDKVTLPLSPPSPESMQECDQLQAQYENLQQQLETEHQSCLAAHSKEPSNPNAGSGVGSTCSHGECQSLHTLRYQVEDQNKIQVQACRDAVNQYQQQEAQQQAATQQAEQLASQELQQQVSNFRAQGDRLRQLNGQRKAAHQTTAQQLKDQQAAAHDQMESQLKPAAQEKVDQLKADAQKNEDSASSDSASDSSHASSPVADQSPSASTITASQVDATSTVDLSGAQQSPSAVAGANADSKTGGPPPDIAIPSAALDSTNPDIQAKVKEIQKLDQMYADNQSFKADLVQNEEEDSKNARWAAWLAPSEILKGLADGGATYIGAFGGPAGKAFAAGYGVVTTVAGQISESIVKNGEAGEASGNTGGSEGSANSGGSLEFAGKIAEGYASVGEILGMETDASAAQKIVGGSLQGVATTAAVGINATQAYEQFNQGHYGDASASAASAIGGATTVSGLAGQALEKSWANGATEYGGNITTAAGFAQAAMTFGQGVVDTTNSIATKNAIPQRYAAVMSSANALDQTLLNQRSTKYAELMNLLSQSNGTIPINVPNSTDSSNQQSQSPTVIQILNP
jgi:hypothetical protein